SVRRPGTFFTCRAFTRYTSKPRSSKIWNRGDPVNSIATVFTQHCFNHSARAYRSCVKVANERTFSVARSGGTATKISVAPISIPAASARITRKTACFPWLSFLRFLAAIDLLLVVEDDGPSRANGYSLNRDRC